LGGSFIPTSTTRAPAFCAASMMRTRFCFICAIGRPRRPSLAPSSRISTAGLCCCRLFSMRAAPPLEVSPEMLALTTI
jgi:hypothetical protein